MPDQCKDILHSVNIWVFDGAEGITFFCLLFSIKLYVRKINNFPQLVIAMQLDR